MNLGVNFRPLLGGNSLQHRAKGNGNRLRLIPHFFDGARPRPRQRFGLFVNRIKSGTA